MQFRSRVFVFLSAGVGAVVSLLLATAWFQIQAVRWGYKAQSLRQQLDELDKREQSLDHRLQETLSLARLDRLAKNKFQLHVPEPSQIILLSDKS